MKSYKQFLLESKTGTYVSARLTTESASELVEWASDIGIPNLIAESELHTTVCYSRKEFDPGYVFKDFDVNSSVIGYDLFGTKENERALVLKLESDELTTQHEEYKTEFGATHDYPEYVPHVTLSYSVPLDFKLESLPPFKIYFEKLRVDPLDLDWSSKVKLKESFVDYLARMGDLK